MKKSLWSSVAVVAAVAVAIVATTADAALISAVSASGSFVSTKSPGNTFKVDFDEKAPVTTNMNVG